MLHGGARGPGRWGLLGSVLLSCGGRAGSAAVPADGGDVGVPDAGFCFAQPQLTVAAKLVLQATWSANLAIGQGAGPITVWTLSTYDLQPNRAITGTTKICGYQTPPIALEPDVAGKAIGGFPSAQIEVVVPASAWNARDMPLVPVTGVFGGESVGSSFDLAPSTTLVGLRGASLYADPTAAWPGDGAMFDPADIVDSDDDGHPGVTGIPRSDGTFVLPHVGITPDTATVDRVYLVLRTGVKLSGTLSSCSELTGTATMNLFNSHVIGCRRVDTMGDCMMADWEYVDAKFSPDVVTTGTFDGKVLPSGGAPATCDDVLALTYGN